MTRRGIRAERNTSGAVRTLSRMVAVTALLALAACTTVLTRNPAPEDAATVAAPYGIRAERGLIREWGDVLTPEARGELIERWSQLQRQVNAADIAAGRTIKESSLALSGGGPDGAFGAGLLNGWTARGDRPEFKVVTGISTGAIVALFAYLGPEYDDELTEIYTTYTTDQLLTPAIFAALLGGTAVTDTSGYRRLIETYITDEVVAKIAEEAKRGRALLIGTTNLDAARPVIWNLGAIAVSGHPMAKQLIQDVIQASSAIPAAFPPAIIPVETADGRVYDEMHVDGGATQQVMFFTPEVSLREFDAITGAKTDRTLYVVMNNKLKKPYDPVRPRVLSIAGTAASSLLSGSGTGDIYKIYAIAERDGIDLQLLGIPRDFDKEAAEPFDPVYMKALYDLGYEFGLKGDGWASVPPDFKPWP